MRVHRPNPQVLVIAERRLSALLGLVVWTGMVSVFYYTFLDSGDFMPVSASEGGATPWKFEVGGNTLFLLFPVFLAPSLLRCLRVLAVGEELTFDDESRMVSKNRVRVAAFGEVKYLQLKTLNGTCEELMLCALLTDGTRVTLHTSGAVAEMVAVADEIGKLLQVEVVREA